VHEPNPRIPPRTPTLAAGLGGVHFNRIPLHVREVANGLHDALASGAAGALAGRMLLGDNQPSSCSREVRIGAEVIAFRTTGSDPK
jgi:hypothetical protein